MDLRIYAYQMLGSLPVFTVWLVGLTLCCKYATSARSTCMLTAMALLIGITLQAVFPLVSTWFLMTYLRSLQEIYLRNLVQYLLDSSIQAVMWILILLAIFGTRRKPAEVTRH